MFLSLDAVPAGSVVGIHCRLVGV